MYVVLFLFLLSVGLATASTLIAVLNILLIAVFYRRITKEEKMMIERFGNEYRMYMKHTGRFWPIIKRSKKTD
jgi:protein-S-isoprenylcysteine O-methyltransferase Ste14